MDIELRAQRLAVADTRLAVDAACVQSVGKRLVEKNEALNSCSNNHAIVFHSSSPFRKGHGPWVFAAVNDTGCVSAANTPT